MIKSSLEKISCAAEKSGGLPVGEERGAARKRKQKALGMFPKPFLLALQRKKPPAMLVRIKCLKQKTSDARIDEGSPTASMQRRSMSCKMT